MKEQVHEIDLGAYFIMSEVADIFSNNTKALLNLATVRKLSR